MSLSGKEFHSEIARSWKVLWLAAVLYPGMFILFLVPVFIGDFRPRFQLVSKIVEQSTVMGALHALKYELITSRALIVSHWGSRCQT